jgi:RNA polymerase sigma factor (TIGR02999 family)
MDDAGAMRVEAMLQRLTDREGRDASLAAALQPLIQDELRELIAAATAPRPVAALVRDAYLRLVKDEGMRPADRAGFLALAARAMRRLLVEAASRRGRAVDDAALPVPALDEVLGAGADDRPDVLAVDDALESLRALDRRAGRVAELRLFGGLTFPELEDALDLSRREVADDWAMARIWLARTLRAGRT